VIGRKLAVRHKARKIAVPTPPRHFLICRGPSCGFEKIASKHFLSRKCSAIPLQSMGNFPGPTSMETSRPENRRAGHNFLSGKASAIPLSVERRFVPSEALCQAIQNFYRPATPSPFPLYATAGGTGMAERKNLLSRKTSAFAF
jgi:hypothetical protein